MHSHQRRSSSRACSPRLYTAAGLRRVRALKFTHMMPLQWDVLQKLSPLPLNPETLMQGASFHAVRQAASSPSALDPFQSYTRHLQHHCHWMWIAASLLAARGRC